MINQNNLSNNTIFLTCVYIYIYGFIYILTHMWIDVYKIILLINPQTYYKLKNKEYE